jgi:cyclopropane fatty-acyl-phospholipid synthase-like methyltransferase
MVARSIAFLLAVVVPTAAALSTMQRSPAFPRNKDPIAAAMEAAGFPDCGTVLELGCGPGEHAPDFARRWPTPTFQPTDADASALRSSDAHAAAAGLLGSRIRAAALVDVSRRPWPNVEAGAYDGCFSINVVHIMPRSAVGTFFAGAAAALRTGGVLGIYDTWTFAGAYVAVWNSNIQPDFNVRICDKFDASSSAVLRELDESNRFVQKSAESTSI